MAVYLGQDVEKFMNKTSMSKEMINDFFHDSVKSAFALQANKVANDMSKQYNCKSGFICSIE